MKCRQARDLIGAYLYGDLAPEEMRDLRVHAQECAVCREDLASRGRIVSSLDDTIPTLTEEEKQRVAWSVRGAVRKEQLRRKPLGRRLVPAFALAGVLIAAITVGRFVVMRSGHPATAKMAKGPAGASVRVKELPPADNSSKSSQLTDQVSELIQSLMNPTATFQPPDRTSGSARSQNPDRRSMIPPESAFKVTEHQIPPAAQQPPAPDANSTDVPKDSGTAVNKTETGGGSEATQLPRVTDPKNAETTPSENK